MRSFQDFPAIYDINSHVTIIPTIRPDINDVTLFCPSTQISFTGLDNILMAVGRPPANSSFGREIILQHYHLTIPMYNMFDAAAILQAVKRAGACPITILLGNALSFTDGQTTWNDRAVIFNKITQLAREYQMLMEPFA